MRNLKLVIFLLAALVGINTTVADCHCGELASFFRYWQASITDHLYTTNVGEIGTSTSGQIGKYGYMSDGTECLVYDKQIPETVPLYRYWNSDSSDHFYTTDADEIGTTTVGETGNGGYKSEGVAGYCFPFAAVGTIPLLRYHKSSGNDHFYTTDVEEIGVTDVGKTGNDGYMFEGVACYVIAYHG